MIKTKLTLLALLALPLIAAADASSKIETTYNTLDDAILAKNGQEAFAQLSDESQAYIESVRQLALTADRDTLSQEPISTILGVFSIRTEAKGKAPASAAETLVLMSGDYAKVSSTVSLGEITVDGDEASAPMILNGNPSPMSYAFVKEDGEWKIDLIEQMKATNEMMKSSMESSGAPREVILEQMARASSSQGVNVWQPIE